MAEPSFVKYGKLVALADVRDIRQFSDRTFSVFEKIDGGNCQVRKMSDGRLVAGSKANFLHGAYLRKREWFEKLNSWMHQNPSLYNLPPHWVMFGEWSGNHNIVYAPRNADTFFVIDVFDCTRERFFHYSEGVEHLQEAGVECGVPMHSLFQGKVKPQDLSTLLAQPSQYYDGPQEGLVLKDYDSPQQLFLKVYHSDFSEKLRLPNGSINCITPARFRKNIYRVIEERGYTSLTPAQLVEGVQEDVKSEEGIALRQGEVVQALSQFRSQGKLLRAARYLE